MNKKILLLANTLVIFSLSALESGKIVFFETNADEVKTFENYLKNTGLTLSFCPEKISDSNISTYKSAEIISVSFSQVAKEIIDKLPNLKLIATRSTGYDHIDHTYAALKSIAVTHVPDYASQSVAEFTFGLILALSRKIREQNRETVETLHFNSSILPGFDLKGKTLGVIGTGNIGKNVIKIAQAFQMTIIAHSRHQDNDFATQNRVTYMPLEKLLKKSDIVTLHTALNKDTHHLINAANITHIKKNALLINTARGELIETKPLIKALKNGTLAAAGLDVLESEHHLESGELAVLNQELMQLPQVIVTPHIAYNSIDALMTVLSITAQNIISFMNKEPKNIVGK